MLKASMIVPLTGLSLALVLSARAFVSDAAAASGPAGNIRKLRPVPVACGPQKAEPEFEDLPKAGRKYRIGEAHSFVYEFDKTPKMGTVILKVRLFDKDGKQVSDLDITGRTDMPAMRGAHDSGDVAFKLNNRGDYLLLINVVMPGRWEVRLTFFREKTVGFRGRISFDV